jgi:hypothetical protein
LEDEVRESQLSGKFLKILKDDYHCKVIKHSDNFTIGVPDASVSQCHRTVWLEFKHLERRKWVKYIDWRVIIKGKDMVQLMTMVELEQKAMAYYVLFCTVNGIHETFLFYPATVLKSIKSGEPTPVGPDIDPRYIFQILGGVV